MDLNAELYLINLIQSTIILGCILIVLVIMGSMWKRLGDLPDEEYANRDSKKKKNKH